MSKPVLILTADWHLQFRAWANIHDIHGDAIYGLSQVVELANRLQVPVVAAGDLFDVPRNAAGLIHIAKNLLAGCSQPILFIEGDHDKVEGQAPWLVSLYDRAVWLENQSFTLPCGFRVSGLNHRPAGEKLEAAILERVQSQQPHIMVLHETLYEFQGPHGFELEGGKLPPGPLYAIGDVHKASETQLDTPNGLVRMVSPGSFCMQSISECPNKSVAVLHDDMSIQRVPLLVRPSCQIVAMVDAELDRICEALPSYLLQLSATAAEHGLPLHMHKPVVGLVYHTTQAPSAPKRIKDVTGDLAVIIERPRLPTVTATGETMFVPQPPNWAWLGTVEEAAELPPGAAADPWLQTINGPRRTAVEFKLSVNDLIQQALPGEDVRQVREDLLALVSAADPLSVLTTLEQQAMTMDFPVPVG